MNDFKLEKRGREVNVFASADYRVTENHGPVNHRLMSMLGGAANVRGGPLVVVGEVNGFNEDGRGDLVPQ